MNLPEMEKAIQDFPPAFYSSYEMVNNKKASVNGRVWLELEVQFE